MVPRAQLPFARFMGSSPRRLVAWFAGAAVLGTLVAALTTAAQDMARQQVRAMGLGDGSFYSLSEHVLAMTLIGILAVTASVWLWQTGSWGAGLLVLAGVAAGPMTVVAAPISTRLVADGNQDTVGWWHLVVGGAVVAVLVSWTTAVVRLSTSRPPRRPWTLFRRPVTVEVALVLVAGSAAWTSMGLARSIGGENPGFLVILGWAALAAGVALGISRARSWQAPVVAWGLEILIILMLHQAYDRDGGWPGVAGWELNGMESPVVFSREVVLPLLFAPALGVLLRWGRSATLAGRPGPETAPGPAGPSGSGAC